MQLYAIVAIIVAIASVLFALQNNVPVSVGFLTWRFDSSLAMVLLLALALGAIVIALISTPATLKRQWTINRQQKHIRDLEAQLATARSAASGMRDVTPASTGRMSRTPRRKSAAREGFSMRWSVVRALRASARGPRTVRPA